MSGTRGLVTVGQGCVEVLEGACLDPTDPEAELGGSPKVGGQELI